MTVTSTPFKLTPEQAVEIAKYMQPECHGTKWTKKRLTQKVNLALENLGTLYSQFGENAASEKKFARLEEKGDAIVEKLMVRDSTTGLTLSALNRFANRVQPLLEAHYQMGKNSCPLPKWHPSWEGAGQIGAVIRKVGYDALVKPSRPQTATGQ